MLVLARKKNEEVVIICPDGTEITVRVTDTEPHKTRLGVTAPREYQVHRREVWTEIQKERQNGSK